MRNGANVDVLFDDLQRKIMSRKLRELARSVELGQCEVGVCRISDDNRSLTLTFNLGQEGIK